MGLALNLVRNSRANLKRNVLNQETRNVSDPLPYQSKNN